MDVDASHHNAFPQSGDNASVLLHGNSHNVQGNQDNRHASIIGTINNVYGPTIHIHPPVPPAAYLHHTIQNFTGASNTAASHGGPQNQFESCYQQAMIAAGDASGLMISTILLLANRKISSGAYRDMKHFFRTLNCTMLATKQALQTFQFTPLGRNLAKMIKPTILSCHEILQGMFYTLDASREGHSFAVIRNLWSILLWSGSEAEGLSAIQRKLSAHQTELREFLAALNSYVQQCLGVLLIDKNHQAVSRG